MVLTLHSKIGFNLARRGAWQILGLCAAIAVVAARSERRLESTARNLRKTPTIASNMLVRKMREYRAAVKWAYSPSGIYAFHAQVPVPPELAIIMPKRYWSGQITTREIIETCRRHNPDLIVLPSPRPSEWDQFLTNNYSLTAAKAFCI